MSVVDPGIQQNIPGSGNIFTATGDVFVFEKPEAVTNRQLLSNLRILLNKVRTFWIQGVLEKSIHHAVLINLDKEVRPEAVEHPWEMVLELPDNERHLLPLKTDVIDIFNQSTRALLILGEPGSGKTTTLLDLANQLIEKAEGDISTEPIPVIFNLSSWGTSKTLADWLIKELTEKYQIPKKIGETWLEQNRLLPLLDGFDEIAEVYRQSCIASINEFIGIYGLPGLVVCSRISEYTRLPVRLKLNAAICVQPLTGKQIDGYLKTAIGKDRSLPHLLKNNDLLFSLAQTPLFLSILCFAHRTSPEEVKNLSAVSAEEYIRKIFDIYVERVLRRKGEKNQYSSDDVQKKLAWLAKRMVERSQTVFQVEQLQPDWLSTAKERLIYFMLSRAILWFLIGFFGLIGFSAPTELGAAALVGAALSLLGPFIGLVDWQRFEQNTTHAGANETFYRVTQRLKDGGYFLWLQLTVLSLWLGMLSMFGLYEGEKGSLLSFQYLGLFFGNVSIWPPARWFILLLFVLELGLFILIRKSRDFLRFVVRTGLTIGGLWIVLVLLASARILIWPALVGLYLVWLSVLWKSEKPLLKIPAVLWLVILSLVALFKRRIFGGIEIQYPFDLLSVILWPGISLLTGLALLVASIWGARGRYNEPSNEVRTTESVSWSWKRALPFGILSIISLLLFAGTLLFKNNVTLWDSQTGRKISALRETPFTRWKAAYSQDGRHFVLLGGKYTTAHTYLYDSSNGRMIAQLGTQQLPVYVSFNANGSRMLVEGTGACPEWCYAQLWDAETGKFINTLNDQQALQRWDLGELGPSLGVSRFTEDGNLIYHSLTLSGRMVPLEGGDTGKSLFYAGYMIYDAQTGSPVLGFFPIPAQNSAQLDIGYLYSTNEKHITVDMSQVSDLLIYDDKVLKEHPLTIVNQQSTGGLCIWSVNSENVDCSPEDPSSDLIPWGPYTISMDKSDRPYYMFAFPQQKNALNLYLDRSQASFSGMLTFGTMNYLHRGVLFPIKVYPFSAVDFVDNLHLPQFITITDGFNPLGYAFGFLAVVAVAALIMRGLSTNVIERKSLPNQGVLLSLRNSLILGGIITLVFGLMTAIVYVLFFGESDIWALVLGFGALIGTLAWALYGGMDVIFHYTLRLMLAIRGYLPWKLIPFLNYCANNLLLQKVGGGYIFIHRMLLENFAAKADK